MSQVLSKVMQLGSRTWVMGVIDNHTARPLTEQEIDDHIEEFDRLKMALAKAGEIVRGKRDTRPRSG